MKAHCQPQCSAIQGTTSGREQRAHVGARVEDAGGERALLLREPLGHRLDGGGEVAGLAQAQQEPHEREAGRGPGEQHDREAGLGVEVEGGQLSQGSQSAIAWAIAATLQSTTAMAKPSRVPSLSMMRPASRRPMA